MTGKSIDYETILATYAHLTPEQAANDLERLLLRGETPAIGSVALAIKTLRGMKNEKQTADEMFRELGYERDNRFRGSILYTKKVVCQRELIIEIDLDNQMVYPSLNGGPVGMTYDEALAAAKLLEELEVAE